MAKMIKFDLLIDGTKVKTFEELQDNLHADILTHLKSGKLAKWFLSRDMADKAEAVQAIDLTQSDLALMMALCEVLELEADEDILTDMLAMPEQLAKAQQASVSNAVVETSEEEDDTPPAPTYRMDWSGQDMSGRRFAGEDFSNCNFEGTNFSRCDFTNANLSGANLKDAILDNVTLNKANLSKAILTSATLTSASLIEANLSDAMLTHAILDSAKLHGANLTHANLDSTSLNNADFSKNYKKEIQKNGQTVTETIKTNATDLTDASFIKSSGTSVKFYNAVLSRANFSYASLEGYFWYAELDHANFEYAVLKCRFDGYDDNTRINLSNANFSFADVTGSTFDWVANSESMILTGTTGFTGFTESSTFSPFTLYSLLGGGIS